MPISIKHPDAIDPAGLDSVTACDDAIYQLDMEIAKIELQIAEEQAAETSTGVATDAEWLIRAQFAIKAKQANRRPIKSRKALLDQVRHRALEHHFVNRARQYLDKQTFDQILGDAQGDLAA